MIMLLNYVGGARLYRSQTARVNAPGQPLIASGSQFLYVRDAGPGQVRIGFGPFRGLCRPTVRHTAGAILPEWYRQSRTARAALPEPHYQSCTARVVLPEPHCQSHTAGAILLKLHCQKLHYQSYTIRVALPELYC